MSGLAEETTSPFGAANAEVRIGISRGSGGNGIRMMPLLRGQRINYKQLSFNKWILVKYPMWYIGSMESDMNEYEILVKFYKPPDMGKLLFLQLCSLGELFDEPIPKKKESIKEVMQQIHEEAKSNGKIRARINP